MGVTAPWSNLSLVAAAGTQWHLLLYHKELKAGRLIAEDANRTRAQNIAWWGAGEFVVGLAYGRDFL